MHNTLKWLVLSGLCVGLSTGCALFEQETTTTEAEPMPVADDSMRRDLNTALQEARQALQEAQNARRLAEQALNAAQQAQNAADACQARCEAVEAQIERAFQQSQSK